MLHIMIDFGRAQQRLGRDAAPVETDAAKILALDDRGLQAELRRADRRNIAAGAGGEDEEVVVGVSYYGLLQKPLSPRGRGGGAWGMRASARRKNKIVSTTD